MTGTAPGLSGNQKRKMKSAARLYAVQALFQMEHSSQTVERVRREFLDHRFGATYDGEEMLDGDITLFARLLENAVNYQAPIDQMTDRALVAKWPIARIDPTLRALFRAAGAELRDTGGTDLCNPKAGKCDGTTPAGRYLFPRTCMYRWAPGNRTRARPEPAPSDLLKATGM